MLGAGRRGDQLAQAIAFFSCIAGRDDEAATVDPGNAFGIRLDDGRTRRVGVRSCILVAAGC